MTDRPADFHQPSYDAGYKDGESSGHADWYFQLSEQTTTPDAIAWNPGEVATYVRNLEWLLAETRWLAEDTRDRWGMGEPETFPWE